MFKNNDFYESNAEKRFQQNFNSFELKKAVEAEAHAYALKLYSYSEISKNRIENIIFQTSQMIKNILASTHAKVIEIVNNSEERDQINEIFAVSSNCFSFLNTQYKQLKEFEKNSKYITPESIEIGIRTENKNVNGELISKSIKTTIEFIPIREVLTIFFQIPGIFEENVEYMRLLDSEENIISNFCQGSLWKELRSSFPEKIVFPLFLFYDDFETDNPLGSHRGLNKCGAVYLSLPNLPPKYQSKIENIFLFALFNTLDRQVFKNNIIFKKIIEELRYLRNFGITVHLSSTAVQIYFQLALPLGDNLGLHSILGFSECFNAKFFCRFCMTERSIITDIDHESQCELRTETNYTNHLKLNNFSTTGIHEECVFHDNIGFHVMKNLSVDPMHDLLEGICPHDIALILNHYIYIKTSFSLDDLNDTIQGFNYGYNYNINKPPEILPHHLKKNKHLSMTSAEMLTLVRHICLILSLLVTEEDEYWYQLQNLKIIVEITMSNFVPRGCHNYLSSYITSYLKSHNKLFPKSMIPKHHFLIHYPRIFENVGILSVISSMRYESKHRELKIIARAAISRVNISHTIAVRHQLSLYHRFCIEKDKESIIDHSSKKKMMLNDLLNSIKFSGLILERIKDPVYYIEWTEYQSNRITINSIFVDTSKYELSFFKVKLILVLSDNEIVFVTHQIDDCYFDEYSQSFKIINSDEDFQQWKFIFYTDLDHYFVTYENVLSDKISYITKLWI